MEDMHVAWCRNLVSGITLGGVWGVPRSGLIFVKTGERTLTLAQRLSVEDVEVQDDDFLAIKEHMAAAGIEVK